MKKSTNKYINVNNVFKIDIPRGAAMCIFFFIEYIEYIKGLLYKRTFDLFYYVLLTCLLVFIVEAPIVLIKTLVARF